LVLGGAVQKVSNLTAELAEIRFREPQRAEKQNNNSVGLSEKLHFLYI